MRRALGVLKAFNLTAPGGFQLNIDVGGDPGSADSGDIEDDLTELLVEVGEAARAGGKGVVYLVDEMQNLEPVAMGALCMAFHKLAQRQLPVALVGAGLPPLPASSGAAKPYAERLFEYFPLGALTDAAARSALVTPATRKGVDYGDGAVELILDAAEGYPYFIQEYGRVVWEEAGARRSRPTRCARRCRSRRRSSTRSSSTTASRRRRTRSAATWPRWPTSATAPQSTGEITARAGYKKRASSGKARQALIRKGLSTSRSTAASTSPSRTSPRSCAGATRSRACCARPRTTALSLRTRAPEPAVTAGSRSASRGSGISATTRVPPLVRALDLEPPVERGEPVGQPAQARAALRIGGADAVVGDLDHDAAVDGGDADVHRRAPARA